MKRFDFTPILGWSVSRYDIFTVCKRQYFYSYYSKYDPIISRKKIDELKKMTSIPMEIGNIVHEIIKVFLERLLKTEEEIDKDRFFDFSYRKTQECCRNKIFSEVYYGELDSINIEAIYEKTKLSLNNFLASDRYEWLMKKAITTKEKWLIDPSGYGETRIDGIKAYCKVDFLFPLEDCVVIIDWKTGKSNEEKHRKQLLGYSCWASYHFDLELHRILSVIAYLLPDYSESEVSVNEYDIQDYSDLVKKETEEMYSYCIDIDENIPKNKESFTETSIETLCNYCNFRELCS